MKAFKLTIFSIIFGVLIFNQYAHTMNKSKIKETEKKDSQTKDKTSFISDPYVFSDAIFPFIEKQTDLLLLRRVSKSAKEGVKLKTEKFEAIKLKTIYPKNVKDFLIWLRKNHKGIDFSVSIEINAKNPKTNSPKTNNILALLALLKNFLENKEITSNNFNEILNLIGEKTKELTLLNFYTKVTDNFMKFLPQTLEELDLSAFTGNNITGEFFEFLPKTLKIIKLFSLANIETKYLHTIPKISVFVLNNIDYEMLMNHENLEKVLILKNKGIKVIDSSGTDYPSNDQEVTKYYEKKHERITAFYDNLITAFYYKLL